MENSTLRIGVTEAKSLPARGIKIAPNAYVIAYVDQQRKATKYISSTYNPVWNEELAL